MARIEHSAPLDFRADVESRLGQKTAICYQCGKCTAGCPMAFDMDLAPNQVVHAVQLDQRAKVLRSRSIWVCASCETCSTRCPKDFDIARLMDILRGMSLDAGMQSPEANDIISFHKSFLNSIRRHGRTHEPEFIAEYKIRSLHFFQDVLNALKMAIRGKIRPLPHSMRGNAAVRRIFTRCREE